MKTACLICTGFVAFHFCTMDAQAASPELSNNIAPIAYRRVVTTVVEMGRLAGWEEVDVEVKQPGERVIVNGADVGISGAQLADGSESQARISGDEKAEPASLHFSHLLS